MFTSLVYLFFSGLKKIYDKNSHELIYYRESFIFLSLYDALASFWIEKMARDIICVGQANFIVILVLSHITV